MEHHSESQPQPLPKDKTKTNHASMDVETVKQHALHPSTRMWVCLLEKILMIDLLCSQNYKNSRQLFHINQLVCNNKA